MKLIYCSHGHRNLPENRFCSACGEKLLTAAQPGLLLGDRYRVVYELGYGGFGRTYLAEDVNRFNEACVLKEFAPQVQENYAIQKAEELFAREAGVLYKLQHPQIPRFRELFRASLEDRDRLFLVQDYVEGSTYRQLLDIRQQQGRTFSEAEVRQLFRRILPVLHYIHSLGVIHRDISPDNLILRSTDQLPVLIDFGGVKQIAATATLKYTSSAETTAPVTRLGKVGYAPEEQLQQGSVSSQSDLYALAVTALVLLTGKEPIELLDSLGHSQPWQQFVSLSPEFKALLTEMLAVDPDDRLPSAQSVLHALDQSPNPTPVPLVSPMASPSNTPSAVSMSTAVTQNVAPAPRSSPALPTHARRLRIPPPFLLLLIPLALLLGAGWWWRDRWMPLLSQISDRPSSVELDSPGSLEKQAQAAGVDYLFLVKLTNATFYDRYPDQQGRTLTNAEADAEWRQRWADIFDEWLTLLQQNLSSESRQKLGSYTETDRNQWKPIINKLYVGSRSLYDLTDAKFFHLFPDQQGKSFLDQPIGQVWQAIATDQIRALRDGKALKQIQFEPGAFSHQERNDLAVGSGQVYTANLATGQIMRLNLQAPEGTSRLSIYLPRPTADLPVLLEDSTDVTWTGTLPQSGYYEIVIVNSAIQPIRYQLNLAVDNVTSIRHSAL
jgi:serine/threonine-protein kinase